MTTNLKVKIIRQDKEGKVTEYTNGYQKLVIKNWKGRGKDEEFWLKPDSAKEVPNQLVRDLINEELIKEFIKYDK